MNEQIRLDKCPEISNDPHQTIIDEKGALGKAKLIVLNKILTENPPKSFSHIQELYSDIIDFETKIDKSKNRGEAKQKPIMLYIYDNTAQQAKIYDIGDIKISKDPNEINLSRGIQKKHAFTLTNENLKNYKISIIN